MRFLMLAAALAPALTLLFFFWERDRWHAPAESVWSAFAIGALAAFPAVAVVALVIAPFAGAEGIYRSAFQQAFLLAAIPEELAKFMVVGLIFFRHDEVSRPHDLVMHSVAVSIGFAALENMFYIAESTSWSTTAALRSLTAVPGHAFTGAVMGAFLSWRRFSGGGLWMWIAALMAPVLMHGIYDFFAMLFGAITLKGEPQLRDVAGRAYLGIALTVILEGVVAIWCSQFVLGRTGIDTSVLPDGSVARFWVAHHRLRLAVWGVLALALLVIGIAGFGLVVLRNVLDWERVQLHEAVTGLPQSYIVFGIALFATFHGAAFAKLYRAISCEAPIRRSA